MVDPAVPRPHPARAGAVRSTCSATGCATPSTSCNDHRSPAPCAPPLLRVDGLSVHFDTPRGPLSILAEVGCTLAPGEILGVVGESGAGKSMLGKAIAGLLDPGGHLGAGSIWLRGERIDTLGAEDRRRLRGKHIGMVFRDPMTSLNPVLTIGRHTEETIRTHLPLTPSQARERALALLQAVGIAQAEAGCANTRTSSPAACASAWPSPGAVRRPCPADRRRAHHRARRHRAGPGDRGAAPPVPRARHRADAGQPRHGRDRGRGRPRDGDAGRARGRERPGGRGAGAPARAVHARTGRRHTAAGPAPAALPTPTTRCRPRRSPWPRSRHRPHSLCQPCTCRPAPRRCCR